MKYRQLGDLRLRRAVESILTADVSLFFSDKPRELWEPHFSWLCPDGLDKDAWRLHLPMQSYIVQTPRHNILIDTCVGSNKRLPRAPHWEGADHSSYERALKAHGLHYKDIHYVMCTHLHTDHCGWNTRLEDGTWVPTFPNARYIFSRTEYEHWDRNRNEIYEQNVQPIVERGLADLVNGSFDLNEFINIEPMPGHTPGHYVVNIRSNDQHAVVTGDLLHSPIQCIHPEWHNLYDWDKEQGAAARRSFLERYADTDTLVCTIHFPLPSAGRIRSEGRAFRFHPDQHDW
jgi:glyoxylase-like metal-dependent hydrolase (beta-lactamase superfamily II)